MDQDTPSQSIAERAAAFKSDAPPVHRLISFRHQAELIEVAYSMSEKAATQFMVEELEKAASGLPVYWLFSGGEVVRIDDTRVPMEPEAIPTAWTCTRTYYPSERDRVLSGLSMALALGYMIGDLRHEASRKAVAMYLPRAEGDAYFIEPSPVRLAVRKREREEEAARQQAATAAASASLDGQPGAAGSFPSMEDPTASKVRRRAIADGFKRTKAPGERWAAADRAELLRQYLVLRGIGEEWAKAELAHAELASRWGITTSSVRVYLTKARAEAEAASKLVRRI